MKKLFLAVFVLTVFFSCESSAPRQEAVRESGESLNQEAVPSSESGELPLSGEDGGDFAAGTEIDESSEAVSSGEEISGEESDEPAVFFPPQTQAETETELPEPRPRLSTPPRTEPPAFTMTPSPPPPALPRVQAPADLPQTSEPPAGNFPEEEAIQVPVPVDPAPPAEPSEPEASPLPPPARNQVPPPAPPPEQKAEPPSPPSFIKPAEPQNPPPVREPLPGAAPLPDLPSRAVPETAGEEIVFSRVVRATVGQIIEIPFRGTGWVYLGELGNRRGIVYDSRRLDTGGGPTSVEGQSFIFRAEAAGTFVLKFYKQDFIEDYIINDYVQVVVGEDYENSRAGPYSTDRGRVIAEPRWPPSSPEAPQDPQAPQAPASPETGGENVPAEPAPAPAPQSPLPATEPTPGESLPPAASPEPPPPPGGTSPGPQQSASDDSIVADAPPQAVRPDFPPNTPPEDFVRRAKEELDAGRVEAALAILDTMKQRYPSGTDEAWWLYGQLLEANSPARDIRLALEYYRRLIRQYPQSPRAGDAQQRIAYLQRYYFNIR